MDLIIGWPNGATFDRKTLRGALNLCAHLLQSGSLGRVVASLPPRERTADRAALSTLAESLLRARAPALAILADLGALDAADLDECLAIGLNDFILLAGESSLLSATHVVASSRLAATELARVHLWLEHGRAGEFQRLLTAWRSAFPFMVNASPAPFPSDATRPAAPVRYEHGPQPLRCAWLKTVLTISNAGTLIPCPRHLATGQDRPIEWVEANGPLQARWAERLSETNVCSSCALGGRFRGSHLDRADLPRNRVPGPADYRDYVGAEAGRLSDTELGAAVTAFAERIATAAQGGAPS